MNWFLDVPQNKNWCRLLTNGRFQKGVSYIQGVLKRWHFRSQNLGLGSVNGRPLTLDMPGFLGATEKAQHYCAILGVDPEGDHGWITMTTRFLFLSLSSLYVFPGNIFSLAPRFWIFLPKHQHKPFLSK